MRETAVERSLAKAVRGAGGLTVKIMPVVAGVPDRLVLLPGGRLFLVEAKAPTGRLRPAQRIWHERAARLGIPVAVLHSPQEVAEWLANVLDSDPTNGDT